MLHLSRWAKGHTGEDELYLAGCVVLNYNANMAVHHAKVFNDMFIFTASNDVDATIGVAAWVYQDVLGIRMRMQRLRTVYLGPDYGDGKVKKVVERGCWNARYVGDDVNPVADLVVEGYVVAWYQGRAELGPGAVQSSPFLGGRTCGVL
jgi:carbamoyltransferase